MLAMTATGRHKLVSLEGAYHGNSFGARSIGEGGVDNGLRGCMKLAPPLDARRCIGSSACWRAARSPRSSWSRSR